MNELIEKLIDLINNDDINGLSKLLTLLDSDVYDDLVLKEKLIKILNTFIDLQLTYTKKDLRILL